MSQIIDAETIAQVRRDLEAAIAETQAEIRRLEAFLAETREAERLQEPDETEKDGES